MALLRGVDIPYRTSARKHFFTFGFGEGRIPQDAFQGRDEGYHLARCFCLYSPVVVCAKYGIGMKSESIGSASRLSIL